MDTETIRKQYLPSKINLLLVGEAPPSDVRDFFYVRSDMTWHTAIAFAKAHERTFQPNDQQTFLEYFKRCGCYYEDISHAPFDHIPPVDREGMLEKAVPGFSARLSKLQPAAIAIGIRRIDCHARIGMAIAGIEVPYYSLPFAGRGHQHKYIRQLCEIVRKHVPPIE